MTPRTPIFDLMRLEAHRAAGRIATKRHPRHPLLIHNYTARCQYERAWDDLTILCRGLVTDLDGRIVARGFPKFFNVEEHESPETNLPPVPWHLPFEVTEKLDGSLGILFPTPEGAEIATRGSFDSEQAARANAILRRHPRMRDRDLAAETTLLFEIIYPENRIVVNYGDREELVLLEAIDPVTGRSRPRAWLEAIAGELGCAVAPLLARSPGRGERYAPPATPNREGVVLKFDDDTRVKIKLEEYKRLHRILCGLNTRDVWERLGAGGGVSFHDWLETIPDEYHPWIRRVSERLEAEFRDWETRARVVLEEVRSDPARYPDRRAIAERFLRTGDLASTLFAMLDGKDHAPSIWRRLRPEPEPMLGISHKEA